MDKTSQQKASILSFEQVSYLAKVGKLRGYNRQLTPENLKDFDSASPGIVWFTIPHHHKFGKACEQHIRLGVHIQDKTGEIRSVIFDTDEKLYQSYKTIVEL